MNPRQEAYNRRQKEESLKRIRPAMKMLESKTPAEVAAHYGVSRERVRQWIKQWKAEYE